ncbi:M949_RS01915 family surface polysaccharide biosynthesis protein [Lewinella sp. W8]|uniref:M949_RS01915 family surface polysaccharide biosynthesis protein n=1 Tax=Lewinella sp. W8 TaxID=2528208 RepID=UPI0010688352|nr:hypothetical protein [Lewinella sp. W8]MTB52683.1 hypothetical protein [Lewinella sp. W8]
MKQAMLFSLVILLFACGDSGDQSLTDNDQSNPGNEMMVDEKAEDPSTEAVDLKTLLKLSPLSVFDRTTEGLTAAEKESLIKAGKSESWEITETTNTRLALNSLANDAVELHYFKREHSPGGALGITVTNGQTSTLQLWNYTDGQLETGDHPGAVSANDFVREADKLPDSFQPQLQYSFVDDEKIEVTLNTWMVDEFETREVINKVYLRWDGEKFIKEIVQDKLASQSATFREIKTPTYAPSTLNHDGEIVLQKAWEDSNGENIVLFTKGEEELFVYHYAVAGSQAKLLRRVYDAEKSCEFDLFLSFIESSISVTDLDENNLGEITFAYRKACISDVSPKELKLLTLENGNKYIIRGTTTLEAPGMRVDGSKTVDASFNEAPASFLTHAESIWEKVRLEKIGG